MRQQTGKRYQSFFIAAISLVLFSGVPFMAVAGEDASDQQATTLETVTVTANKQEENAHEVPQAITVIDEEILEEKEIKNIHDIIKYIPNMNSVSNFADEINFRGLNASTHTHTSSVVVYIDGVPNSNMMNLDIALQNAERVEVLRGPQGTLYGKDAMGAVINIITKKPRDVVSGSVGLGYSSFNTPEGRFNVSAPIIDEKLYFGLNAFGKKSDGWMENTYKNDKKAGKNEEKKFGAYLLARPIENLSIKLDISHKEKEINGFDQIGIYEPKPMPIELATRKKAKKQAYEGLSRQENTTDHQALNIDYNLENLKLSSTTTYKKWKLYRTEDLDYQTSAPIFGMTFGEDEKADELTQELRISNKNDKFKWIGGVYFDKGNIDFLPMWWDVPMPLNPATPNILTNMKLATFAKQNYETLAAFGQVKFPIIDKLNLTLGARLQKFTKEIDMNLYMHPFQTPTPNTPANQYTAKKSWDTFLPKIALDYKLNEHLMPYTSISKGYMPGGFNIFTFSNNESENTFEPQKSTNYELGIKGFYNHFSFTANIFRMELEDMQVAKIEGTSNILTNAKKAHSQGVEFDFNYWPTNELEFSGAFGYVDAKYDDHDLGNVKLDGETIEGTPKFNANLGVAYYHGSGIYGRVDGRAVGKTSYYSNGFQKMEKIGSSFFADVKLGYRMGDFDIYGFVKNLTDEERVTGYVNRGDLALASFNDPRTFGVGINYKF